MVFDLLNVIDKDFVSKYLLSWSLMLPCIDKVRDVLTNLCVINALHMHIDAIHIVGGGSRPHTPIMGPKGVTSRYAVYFFFNFNS